MDDVTQTWLHENKAERTASYHWLGALDALMRRGLNCTLEQFVVPDGVIARPLTADEVRVWNSVAGVWCVLMADGTMVPELPPSVHPLPLLVLPVDQCSVSWAAGHFCMGRSSKPYLLSLHPDEYHMEWNEILRATASTKNSRMYKIFGRISGTSLDDDMWAPFSRVCPAGSHGTYRRQQVEGTKSGAGEEIGGQVGGTRRNRGPSRGHKKKLGAKSGAQEEIGGQFERCVQPDRMALIAL